MRDDQGKERQKRKRERIFEKRSYETDIEGASKTDDQALLYRECLHDMPLDQLARMCGLCIDFARVLTN